MSINKISIVSFVDKAFFEERDGFVKWHRHLLDGANIQVLLAEGSGNSGKLECVEMILNQFSAGDIVILCDIDTRIKTLDGLEELMQNAELGIFFRKSYPVHLALLSGFLIIKVGASSGSLLRKWLDLYNASKKGWFDDQITLTQAVMLYYDNSCSSIIRDISTFRSKAIFRWSTSNSLLCKAYSHKGNRRFVIDRSSKPSRIVDLIDTLLVPLNSLMEFIRHFRNG